jgi:TPR repeat protein
VVRACIALALIAACGKTEAPAPEPAPVKAAPAPLFAVASVRDRWERPIDPAKVPRSPKKALAYHEQQCRDHEHLSCIEVARIASEGIVIPRDVTRAKGFLRIACDGGSTYACYQMATFEPEPASQLEIEYVLGRYHMFCQDYRSHEACTLLGEIYRLGELVRPDLRRAANLFVKACAGHDAVGCNNLGAMRALGEGGPHDESAAKLLFTKACSRGSREGCINAGIDPAHPPAPIEE